MSSSSVDGSLVLPATYTCDGPGGSPALAWSAPPSGTQALAVLMTTLPGDGSTKYNWVMHGIAASRTSLPAEAFGLGTPGVGSDGPVVGYQPPCSQGPGSKTYTLTVYALSADVPASDSPYTGEALLAAMQGKVLASGSLSVTYARSASSTGNSQACQWVRSSLLASSQSPVSVGCDAQYAYVNSNSLPQHAMMDGITATNLQVPVPQHFFGSRAWRIPLAPALAATPTDVTDGPVGVAVNGVPIFNPCKQGGCAKGDTKVLGELDACNGHAGRADDYHYHAAPVCLMASKPASWWDTHPLGWALDGFAIFGYRDASGQVAPRDSVCGGSSTQIANAPAGYAYHVTDAAPYVLGCLRGVPSPDLAGQAAKFQPLRQPPVTPFGVQLMSWTQEVPGVAQVVRWVSAQAFTTTTVPGDVVTNPAGAYRIRYQPVKGSALEALLALPANKGRSACWHFEFLDDTGRTTQAAQDYCK